MRAGERFTLAGAVDTVIGALDEAGVGRAVIVRSLVRRVRRHGGRGARTGSCPRSRPRGRDGRAVGSQQAALPGSRLGHGDVRRTAPRCAQSLVLPDTVPGCHRGPDRGRRVLAGRRRRRRCEPSPENDSDLALPPILAPRSSSTASSICRSGSPRGRSPPQPEHPRRVLLNGAIHLSNLDRPAAFNEAIRRFVRSLPEDTG